MHCRHPTPVLCLCPAHVLSLSAMSVSVGSGRGHVLPVHCPLHSGFLCSCMDALPFNLYAVRRRGRIKNDSVCCAMYSRESSVALTATRCHRQSGDVVWRFCEKKNAASCTPGDIVVDVLPSWCRSRRRLPPCSDDCERRARKSRASVALVLW